MTDKVRGALPAKSWSSLRSMAPSLGLLAGLAVISGLVLWSGLDQVLDILTAAGPSLLLVLLLSPPELWTASEAWRQLFPKGQKPRPSAAFRASWMGIAVNTLLPVATVGGEVVKARALVLSGEPLGNVAAATLVDKTVQAIVILIWGLVGLLVLATLTSDRTILLGGLAGALLLALGIGGFIAVQLLGGFGLFARMSSGFLQRLGAGNAIDLARDVDLAVRALYRRPGALALAIGLRLAGQIWLVSEVLLTAYLLGQAVGFFEALMLRALIGAVRGLSFVIPAGLGLQEGAYIALGALIGLPADMMLALSLASRLREVAQALPGLLAWQHAEGRRLWRGPAARPAISADDMTAAT